VPRNTALVTPQQFARARVQILRSRSE